MDFSTVGGFGEALGGAGANFLSSISGQLGSALGSKLTNRLGLGPKNPNTPPTPSPVPAAAAPQAAIQPVTAAGMSTLAVVGAVAGITAAIALVIFAVVKLAK